VIRFARSVLALAVVATVHLAGAHALQVFVTVDGTVLEGSAYFTGSGAARAVPVHLESERDDAEPPTVLARTTTRDEDGTFRFDLATIPPPAEATLRVVAETLDGHRAVWTLREEDLAGIPREAPARDVGVREILAGLAGIVALTGLAGWASRRHA